jgi:hypothetical protein
MPEYTLVSSFWILVSGFWFLVCGLQFAVCGLAKPNRLKSVLRAHTISSTPVPFNGFENTCNWQNRKPQTTNHKPKQKYPGNTRVLHINAADEKLVLNCKVLLRRDLFFRKILFRIFY